MSTLLQGGQGPVVATTIRAAYDLTPRELRVLRLLANDHKTKTAAVELGVSVNIVAFHIKQIYEKLQVHSKMEAVSKALESGLI